MSEMIAWCIPGQSDEGGIWCLEWDLPPPPPRTIGIAVDGSSSCRPAIKRHVHLWLDAVGAQLVPWDRVTLWMLGDRDPVYDGVLSVAAARGGLTAALGRAVAPTRRGTWCADTVGAMVRRCPDKETRALFLITDGEIFDAAGVEPPGDLRVVDVEGPHAEPLWPHLRHSTLAAADVSLLASASVSARMVFDAPRTVWTYGEGRAAPVPLGEVQAYAVPAGGRCQLAGRGQPPAVEARCVAGGRRWAVGPARVETPSPTTRLRLRPIRDALARAAPLAWDRARLAVLASMAGGRRPPEEEGAEGSGELACPGGHHVPWASLRRLLFCGRCWHSPLLAGGTLTVDEAAERGLARVGFEWDGARVGREVRDPGILSPDGEQPAASGHRFWLHPRADGVDVLVLDLTE